VTTKYRYYPQFLNWCSSTDILNQTEQEITASISINKSAFRQTFTTLNTLTPNALSLIATELTEYAKWFVKQDDRRMITHRFA
jgi:ribosome-associated toxin RatA of RatAB toxin-antitoxin module